MCMMIVESAFVETYVVVVVVVVMAKKKKSDPTFYNIDDFHSLDCSRHRSSRYEYVRADNCLSSIASRVMTPAATMIVPY